MLVRKFWPRYSNCVVVENMRTIAYLLNSHPCKTLQGAVGQVDRCTLTRPEASQHLCLTYPSVEAYSSVGTMSNLLEARPVNATG